MAIVSLPKSNPQALDQQVHDTLSRDTSITYAIVGNSPFSSKLLNLLQRSYAQTNIYAVWMTRELDLSSKQGINQLGNKEVP